MGNRLCFLMYIYVLNSTFCFNLIAVSLLVSALFVKFFKSYDGQFCASWDNEVCVK